MAIRVTVFGWSGEHLHRFLIHGTEYGICYASGPGFRDDARTIRLGELGLRRSERFTYEYNYFAAWTCDLHLEQILGAQPGRTHGVSAVAAPAHPRNGTGHGRSWSRPSRIWCSTQ